MLDKTIPYKGVLMVKDDPYSHPRPCLPAGYYFCMYEKGLEYGWAELEASLGEFTGTADALGYFRKEYMTRQGDLPKRCIFVKTASGSIAGTSSLWFGDHFGSLSGGRIHWLGVGPAHQGKGLAKALLSKTLDLYPDHGDNGIMYLTTQTWSYKAVNIYLSFGFEPYMGPRPANWNDGSNDFGYDNIEAWDMIFKKIERYKNSSKDKSFY